jgi:hypothetical protein
VSIETSIRAVQKKLGVAVDGKSGPVTWRAINVGVIGKKPATYVGLDAMIRVVQKKLGIFVDGNPGVETWDAVHLAVVGTNPKVADLQPEKPSVSPEKGFKLLAQQLVRFNDIPDYTQEYGKWSKLTWLCMEKAFGKNHPNVAEFRNRSDENLDEFRTRLDAVPELIKRSDIFNDLMREEKDRLRHRQALLIQGYEEELRLEIDTRPPLVPPAPVAEKVTVAPSKKVFIVHGHDGELKEATARLVSRLNLEPVILHYPVDACGGASSSP